MKNRKTTSSLDSQNTDEIYWSDKQEVIASNKPLKYLLHLLKYFPRFFVHSLIYPVGFFYYIFAKQGRNQCLNYQKHLYEYTNHTIPKRISAYKQFVSFSLCVLEKMEGWLGKFFYKELNTFDDDLKTLQNQLEEGKGAILLGSHLGNMELMRSLSTFGENGVNRNYSIITIMELKSTSQFNKTLSEINPNVDFQVISPSDFGPETIIQLEEQIANGGLVVIAGDRTSPNARTRNIKKTFLGKEAYFPYGTFLIPALLKAPVYHIFALRTKNMTIRPIYNMYVEKSKVNFENLQRAEREQAINDLCQEFVDKLEKYTKMYPYQWYNFFNFWEDPENKEK